MADDLASAFAGAVASTDAGRANTPHAESDSSTHTFEWARKEAQKGKSNDVMCCGVNPVHK